MSRSVESLLERQFEAIDHVQDPITLAEILHHDRPVVSLTARPEESVSSASRIGLAVAIISVLAISLVLAWYTSAVPSVDPIDRNETIPQPIPPSTLSAPDPTTPPEATTPTTIDLVEPVSAVVPSMLAGRSKNASLSSLPWVIARRWP